MQLNKFIDDYLIYTKNTETPENMHLWCALSALAGAVERRVWIDRGMFSLYLNMYVVLIGPPGLVAKTTSLGFATKLLQEAGYNVIDMVATKEKIIDEMYSSGNFYQLPNGNSFPHTSVTFSMSELNTLLTAGTDMVLFLTSIWDKNDLYTYKTKNSGEFDLINPYFNLIGAATTEWFQKATESTMLSTGFLARCILVYADRKRARFPKPYLTDEQHEARERCKVILDKLSDYYGELEMSPEAEKFYGDWYNSLPDSQIADARISGYLERKAKTFILKVAGLLAIGDLRTVISKKDVENSIFVFDMTEPALKQCLLLLGGNKLAQYIRYVISELLKAKTNRLSQVDLYRSMYAELSTDEMVELFKALRSMDLVRLQGGVAELINKKQAEMFLFDPTLINENEAL